MTAPDFLGEWIGELKGASAHYVNHRVANRKVFEWQTGYGVVSFGRKAMPWVVRYVENQREHHAKQTTCERLERVEIEKRKPVETGCVEISGDHRTGRKRPVGWGTPSAITRAVLTLLPGLLVAAADLAIDPHWSSLAGPIGLVVLPSRQCHPTFCLLSNRPRCTNPKSKAQKTESRIRGVNFNRDPREMDSPN